MSKNKRVRYIVIALIIVALIAVVVVMKVSPDYGQGIRDMLNH